MVPKTDTSRDIKGAENLVRNVRYNYNLQGLTGETLSIINSNKLTLKLYDLNSLLFQFPTNGKLGRLCCNL